MKRVLITGAGSYLGKSLAAYLAQWPEEYQVQSISVRDDSWKKLDFRGFDAVYHTAALVHQEQSKNDPAQQEAYDRVNARLPVLLAEKAKAEGVRQFLFLSTMAVYGLTAPFGKTVTITKDTPIAPTDLYGQSKAKAEKGLLALQGGGFQVAILRPPMIYGRGCKGNYQALAAMAGKLPCFPKIDNRRSMLYVGNLNCLVRFLLRSGEGGVFCPQNRETVDTGRMVQEIARAHGKRLPLIPGTRWALELLRPLTPKIDKAFGSLCYDPALSQYSKDYCRWDFPQSIAETEGEPPTERSFPH